MDSRVSRQPPLSANCVFSKPVRVSRKQIERKNPTRTFFVIGMKNQSPVETLETEMVPGKFKGGINQVAPMKDIDDF